MKNFIMILVSILLIGVIGIGGVHVYENYFADDEKPGITDDAGDDADKGDDKDDNKDNGANGGNTDGGDNNDDVPGGNGGNTETPGADDGAGDDSSNVEALNDLYVYKDMSPTVDFEMLGRKSFSLYVNGNGSGYFTDLITVDSLPDYLDVSSIPGLESAYNMYPVVFLTFNDVSYFNNSLLVIYLTDGETVPDKLPENIPGFETPEEPEEPDVPDVPVEPVEETSTVKAIYVPNDSWTVNSNVAGDAVSCNCCDGVNSDVFNVYKRTPGYSNGYSSYGGLDFAYNTDNVKSISFNLHLEVNDSKSYLYFPEISFLDESNQSMFAVQFAVWKNRLSFKVLGSNKNSDSYPGFNFSLKDLVDSTKETVYWTSQDIIGDTTYNAFDAMIKIEFDNNVLNIYKDGELFRTADLTNNLSTINFNTTSKICFGLRADDVNPDITITEYNIGTWYFHNVVLERMNESTAETFCLVPFTPVGNSLYLDMQGKDSFILPGLATIYTPTTSDEGGDIMLDSKIIAKYWLADDGILEIAFFTNFTTYAKQVGLLLDSSYYHLPITFVNK